MHIPALSVHAAEVAAAWLLAACASAPLPMECKTAEAGSSWEIALRNTGSYGKDAQYTVTRGATTWKGAPALLTSSPGGSIVVDPQTGAWLAMLAPDGATAIPFDPPVKFDFPLTLGKTWTRHQRMTTHASGRTLEYDVKCSVDGLEKVSVPAGSDHTYRVDCRSNIGNHDVLGRSRSAADRVGLAQVCSGRVAADAGRGTEGLGAELGSA